MIRIITIQLFLTAISLDSLFARNNLMRGRFEVQGTLLYSFSHQTNPPYEGETFDRYFRENTLTLQPSIGYFVSDSWELLLQPRFSFQSQSHNYGDITFVGSRYQITEEDQTYRSYSLGILAGLFFHFPLSQAVYSFIGASAGWNWAKYSWQDSSPIIGSYSSPWSGAEVSFPNFAAGLKIFLLDNWALIPQAQLMNTINGYYDGDISVSIGVGFAVYSSRKNGG